MANVVPGAIYKPISHYRRPLRRKGRGACGHVAVSNSVDLRPWNQNDWHFYLPKIGPAIQYVDLDYVAFCQGDGNPTLVSWESQGGVDNADGEPWTANQVEWGARIYAHLNKTEGAPLQVMPNSLPTSRGLGYHRLGIDPWRISGGELWSSSYGKLCPGAAKIAQIPQIITRAKQIVAGIEEDFMATMSDGEKAALMEVVMAFLPGKTGRPPGGGWSRVFDTDLNVKALLAREGVDTAEFIAAVRPLMIEAVQAGMAADNAEQADEIVDRLAARLGNA